MSNVTSILFAGTLEALKSTGKEEVTKPAEHRTKEMTRGKGRGKKQKWRRVPLNDAVQLQVV